MSSDAGRSPGRISIRGKLTLLVLALVGGAAVLTGLLSYGPMSAEIERDFDQHLAFEARQRAHWLEESIATQCAQVETLADQPGVRTAVFDVNSKGKHVEEIGAASWQAVNGIPSHSPQCLGAAFLRPDGTVGIASQTSWLESTPKDLFGVVLPKDDLVPSRPFVYQEKLAYAIAKRIATDGRNAGQLLFVVDFDATLQALERSFRVGSGERVLYGIPDRDGVTSFRKGAREDERLLPLVAIAASGAQDIQRLEDARGTKVIAALSTIEPLGGGLAVVVDADEAYAARLGKSLAWIVLGVLAIGTLGAFLLARHFTMPILELMQAAERVTAGERGVQVAARGRGEADGPAVPDEIGRLVGAFNRMTAELDRSYQTLERRVRERTAELESVNAEISSFSHSVAHDLRAPLRAIAGYGDILCDEKAVQVDAEARDMLERMRYNARRLGQLIDDLLAFSGIGRRELDIRPVDPALIVRDVLDDFEHLTRGRRIDFELRELAGCDADEALLSLVFSNLLSNAIKYTRPREHAVIVVGCEKRDGEAAYYVRDNGVGFDMNHASELFGIFQRLHGRGEFEGTGVGLAIARRVVERHGGRIWADSQPEQGATFWFTLGRVGVGPRTKSTREMAAA